MKLYNKGQAEIQWGEPGQAPDEPSISKPGKMFVVKDEETAKKLLRMFKGVLINVEDTYEDTIQDKVETSPFTGLQTNIDEPAAVQETDEELIAKADDIAEDEEGNTVYKGTKQDGSPFEVTVPKDATKNKKDENKGNKKASDFVTE